MKPRAIGVQTIVLVFGSSKTKARKVDLIKFCSLRFRSNRTQHFRWLGGSSVGVFRTAFWMSGIFRDSGRASTGHSAADEVTAWGYSRSAAATPTLGSASATRGGRTPAFPAPMARSRFTATVSRCPGRPRKSWMPIDRKPDPACR